MFHVAFFIIGSLLLAQVQAWRHASKSELDEALRIREHTLVAFVDPDSWSGQLLATEWETITYSDKSAMSINCAVNWSICEEHDVRSYPAIRLYRSPKTFEYYRGPRQAKDISAFVSRSLRPVISSLGLENVTDFAYTDSVVFILRLTDRDAGKGLYKRFHDLASDNAHRYSFGVISRDPEDGSSSLDCFNNLDDVTLSTTDFFSHIFSLDEFLTSCATRMVTEMTHRNKADFIESEVNVLYFFDFNLDRREQFALHIKETARKYAQHLRFVTVDPPAFPDVPSRMELEWKFPAIALQNKNAGLTYHSEQSESITPGFVENFLRSVAGGKVQPASQKHVDAEPTDGAEAIPVEKGDYRQRVMHDEL